MFVHCLPGTEVIEYIETAHDRAALSGHRVRGMRRAKLTRLLCKLGLPWTEDEDVIDCEPLGMHFWFEDPDEGVELVAVSRPGDRDRVS